MKVKIKDKLSGRIRELNKRDADILVKLKRAEYYDDTTVAAGTYQTRMMQANSTDIPATPPAPAAPPEPPIKPLESGAKNADTETGESTTPPKKKKTKKKIKTKVSTSKE